MNPAASAHKSVLKQVVQEEEQEIERNFKGTIKQHAMATLTEPLSDSDAELPPEVEDKDEFQGKPVQREKKKTQTEINKKVRRISTDEWTDGGQGKQGDSRRTGQTEEA